MSAAAKLLDRLERVKQVAPGRWIASCPIHNTKGQALSIREVDGRVLLHDFGGCGTDEVLKALGLTVSDLFEERLPDARSRRPNHFHARKEAFETIHKESRLVAIAAESLAAGVLLPEVERDRLCLAAERIRTAVEVCR
jgi:hypothetical protein